MRVALYFAPPPETELSLVAARWLGRDAWTGSAVEPDARIKARIDDRGELVRDPKRYGFHATLKPPFRLADARTVDDLRVAVAEFAGTAEAVVVPAMRLERIGAFFALTPEKESLELRGLADAVVRTFESFRAPLTEADVARRRPERLTERQRRHLATWGYPYVFEDFRFHMTLTGPVPENRQDEVEGVLRALFAPFIGKPLAVNRLCLFVEPTPPGDFVIDSAAILR